MATVKNAPQVKKIPIYLKPGDALNDGIINQVIRLSFSDFTDAGYIDLAIVSSDAKKDIQPSFARIYVSGNDNVDKMFVLSGKGALKKSVPAIYLQGENIRLVDQKKKNKVEQAVLGNQLLSIMDEFLTIFDTHVHPMESPPIASKTKIKNLKNKLKLMLSETVSLT
jgi:hypothetical protein